MYFLNQNHIFRYSEAVHQDRNGFHQDRNDNYQDRNCFHQDRNGFHQDRNGFHQDRNCYYQDRNCFHQDRNDNHQDRNGTKHYNFQKNRNFFKEQREIVFLDGLSPQKKTHFQSSSISENRWSQSHSIFLLIKSLSHSD